MNLLWTCFSVLQSMGIGVAFHLLAIPNKAVLNVHVPVSWCVAYVKIP